MDFGTIPEYLQEFVNDVKTGNRDILKKGVSIFRNSGPGTSVGIANGVKIEASNILCFDEITPGNDEGIHHKNVYRIRLTLLKEGSPCQLLSRHWILRHKSGMIDEVKGEAVVRQYPYLSRKSIICITS